MSYVYIILSYPSPRYIKQEVHEPCGLIDPLSTDMAKKLHKCVMITLMFHHTKFEIKGLQSDIYHYTTRSSV